MLSLLGLQDDYLHDGRVILEPLHAGAVPQSLRAHRETLLRLGAVYKQLNAPFGLFASATLAASTHALASGGATGDTTYTAIEGRIASLTGARDALARQIRALLEAAAFGGQAVNEQQAKRYIRQSVILISQAAHLTG
jgi:DNA-directed RNA polymerase specialized sigma54-like protein